MPQLDPFTYLTQFLWLVVFFMAFYVLLYNDGLPKISAIFKLRSFGQESGSKVLAISPLDLSKKGKNNLHPEGHTNYLQEPFGQNYTINSLHAARLQSASVSETCHLWMDEIEKQHSHEANNLLQAACSNICSIKAAGAIKTSVALKKPQKLESRRVLQYLLCSIYNSNVHKKPQKAPQLVSKPVPTTTGTSRKKTKKNV